MGEGMGFKGAKHSKKNEMRMFWKLDCKIGELAHTHTQNVTALVNRTAVRCWRKNTGLWVKCLWLSLLTFTCRSPFIFQTGKESTLSSLVFSSNLLASVDLKEQVRLQNQRGKGYVKVRIETTILFYSISLHKAYRIIKRSDSQSL